jgi:hypothetical protein
MLLPDEIVQRVSPISSRKFKEPLKHNNHGLTPLSMSLAIAIPFHAIIIVSYIIFCWLMNKADIPTIGGKI